MKRGCGKIRIFTFSRFYFEEKIDYKFLHARERLSIFKMESIVYEARIFDNWKIKYTYKFRNLF